MRIDFGPAQHLVDQVDQAIGHGMFEVFRFVVDLRPAHSHHPDEEQLDQAVPSQHERGELLTRTGQPDAGVGLVVGEPGLGERFDHGGCGSRHNAQGRRQLSHRDQRVRPIERDLRLEDRLQIVLNGL